LRYSQAMAAARPDLAPGYWRGQLRPGLAASRCSDSAPAPGGRESVV